LVKTKDDQITGFSCSTLTLQVEQQEGHPAHKNPVVVPVSLSFVRVPAYPCNPELKGHKAVVRLFVQASLTIFNSVIMRIHHYYYLVMMPHVESSLVAMSQDGKSIRTEDTTKKTKVSSTDLTNPNLHHHTYQTHTIKPKMTKLLLSLLLLLLNEKHCISDAKT